MNEGQDERETINTDRNAVQICGLWVRWETERRNENYLLKTLIMGLQGGSSLVDLLCVFFCLVFAMPLCASAYMCLVVTCWERADLLALVCGV